MYIRRVLTRNNTTGESYFTHRLVRTERIGNRVRQVTLLNLGRHFAVAQEDWPSLCPRIEEILTGQAGLLSLKPALETLAQRYAAQLLLRQGQSAARFGEMAPAHHSATGLPQFPKSLECDKRAPHA